ncbi:MAG TPA: hypothetical protein VKY65_15220 [Alphaproteobacteria bacterium]|nr:hypothetical protein [Alphaproteobacteria bacterium]
MDTIIGGGVGDARHASRSHFRFLFGGAALATLIVVGLKLALAREVVFCGGADACFYYALARELAQHHDFFVDFVWNYQVPHVQLPSLAAEYWRPGTSLLLSLALPFGEITLRSSAVIATIATLVTALSAAYLAWSATEDRTIAVLSYLICLCLPSFWTMPLTPDSGSFYAAAVAWFLALFTAQSRGVMADLLGIGCIGLAYLIRNDAVLLGAPFAAVLAKRMLDQQHQGLLRREWRRPIWLCAAFVAALLPAHLLTYAILGRFLNSSITQVLYFNHLEDFYRYGSLLNFQSWIANGVEALARQRLLVLAQTLHHLLSLYGEPATMLALVAAGLAIVAARERAVLGWGLLGPVAFLVAIIFAYVFVMPAIGAHAILRSYEGFLPALAVLAALGVRRAAGSRAAFVILAILVILFSAMDGITEARNFLADARAQLAAYRAEASVIERGSGAQAIAMVLNPAPFTATTEIPSVPIPSNGIAAVRRAIGDFKVTCIVTAKWGGEALASALGAVRVEDVPNTDEVVIFVRAPSSS